MRPLLPIAVVALAIGCGSPTAPDGALPLSAGTYSLTTGAVSRLCRDDVQPRVVRYIVGWVTLSLEGTTWVARPRDAASGSFELRLDRGDGADRFSASPVRGTFTGRLQDVGVAPFEPPSGVRLETAQAGATVGVNGSASGAVASGAFESPLVFSNAVRSMTCPAESLNWALIRDTPPS
ncbi:MAG TPA: hypothetical protein VMN81_08450 [Vicinamibacterales bacterium]|nr:hypothetical protein [Vicinamibacterales bacterium]